VLASAARAISHGQQPPGSGPRGCPVGKLPDLPAGTFSSTSTLLHSTLRKEFDESSRGQSQLTHVGGISHGRGKGAARYRDAARSGNGRLAARVGRPIGAPEIHRFGGRSLLGARTKRGNWDSFEGIDAALRTPAWVNHTLNRGNNRSALPRSMARIRAGESPDVGSSFTVDSMGSGEKSVPNRMLDSGANLSKAARGIA
jgi:hypothetical protein